MLSKEGLPDIRLELLDTKGQAAVLCFHPEHYGANFLALLENLRRMLHTFGPAQVAHVHQTVDAVFNFNEGAKVGKIAHPAFHNRACRIARREMLPGVLQQLLHAQRNAAVVGIDAEHNRLYLISWLDQLGGMLHPLGLGHLGDMHQPLDALLQLNKGAVVGHAEHPAAYASADGITFDRIEPGIGCELLETQRNALLLTIELEHLDLDLVPDVYQVTGVGESSPRHIGYM